MDETQDTDAAAEAFEGVRAEVALLRRAVERMAAKRAGVEMPDYTVTLGQMAHSLAVAAKRLDVLAGSPALGLTPVQMAAQITTAAEAARRGDHEALVHARGHFEQTQRDMYGLMASARDRTAQDRWVWNAAAAGLVAGAVLWMALAGPVARSMPANWLWPERMAARTLRLPLWDAGQQLMAAANPEGWQGIVAGDRIVRANNNVLEGCRRVASKAQHSVKCTIRIDRAPS